MKHIKPEIIDMVHEFHVTFGHPTGEVENGGIPSQRRLFERVGYQNEEMDELFKAILADDPVATIDALGDLIYFTNGTLVEMNLREVPPSKFEISEVLSFEDLGTDLIFGWMNMHANIGELASAALYGDHKKTIGYCGLLHHFICGMFERLNIDCYSVVAEIHRSNMTKVWKFDSDEAVEAAIVEAGYNLDDVYYELKEAGYVVKNKSDNKVRKPLTFEEPNLEQFV